MELGPSCCPHLSCRTCWTVTPPCQRGVPQLWEFSAWFVAGLWHPLPQAAYPRLGLCSPMERDEQDLQDEEQAQPGSTAPGTPEICHVNIWGQILQESHFICVSCAHPRVTELHIHLLLPSLPQ